MLIILKTRLKHLDANLLESLKLNLISKASRKALLYIYGEVIGTIYPVQNLSSLIQVVFDEKHSDFYILRKLINHNG